MATLSRVLTCLVTVFLLSFADAGTVRVAQGSGANHIHWTKEEYARRASAATRAAATTAAACPTGGGNLLYHGGRIMPNASQVAIFWGARWATYSGDIMTGVDRFLTYHRFSAYARTVNEYTGTNGRVTDDVSYLGRIIDTSTPGATAYDINGVAVLNMVCKHIINPDPTGNGLYHVIYPTARPSAVQYCAYHGDGVCNGVRVQYAFYFDPTNDAPCQNSDTRTSPSLGLSSLTSTLAHEIEEARSDPGTPGGWYDCEGNENGDKCAYSYNGYQIFADGSAWRLQGEWSNAAGGCIWSA